MPALSDMDLDRLAHEFSRAGCNPSHAPRLLRHYHDNCGKIDWSQLTLGRRVQQYITEMLAPRQSRIVNRHTSSDGTTKLLVDFDAGGAVESVLMPGYRADRAAGCVSSQIGCALGCDFCASTKNGLERNLSAGEIVEQFLHLRAEAQSLNRRLTSLVFMGMGEPMLNLPAVIDAIGIIAGPQTGALGWRQITVSTVGIVSGIDALAKADLNVHLALSLHAPDDETRAKLVPMNRRYPVAQIIEAAKRFQEKTGRVVTIEYCLLADVNDSDDHAQVLANLLQNFRAHVNIIPYNPIGPGLSGKTYRRPHELRVERFLALLRESGVVSHRRDTRGDDVNAACGQLKAQSVLP